MCIGDLQPRLTALEIDVDVPKMMILFPLHLLAIVTLIDLLGNAGRREEMKGEREREEGEEGRSRRG